MLFIPFDRTPQCLLYLVLPIYRTVNQDDNHHLTINCLFHKLCMVVNRLYMKSHRFVSFLCKILYVDNPLSAKHRHMGAPNNVYIYNENTIIQIHREESFHSSTNMHLKMNGCRDKEWPRSTAFCGEESCCDSRKACQGKTKIILRMNILF